MQGKKYYWLKDKRSKELVIGMLEQDTDYYGDHSSWFLTNPGMPHTLEEIKGEYKLIKRIPFPNEKVK